MRWVVLSAFLATATAALTPACELCAIYNAADARGQFSSGFLLAVEEQFTAFGTPQLNGKEIDLPYPNYLDNSITHFVPNYNFSPQFGVSLNLPVIYNSFERTDYQYSASAAGPLPIRSAMLVTEKGREAGIGDLALIGRWTPFNRTTMNYGLVLNLLGGVKLPTGDSSRLQEEIDQDRIYQKYFLPPGTPHDPLSHSISSIHPHDLALGSGSVDGILGITFNARWNRWFFNSQFQYYLRTEGEASFEYGDELIVAFGPGAYVLLGKNYTLSLRANASYESMAKDKLLGKESDLTGETSWLFGPQIIFTWGRQLSVNAGVDLPLRVANRGLQNAPDYRIRAGATWRF